MSDDLLGLGLDFLSAIAGTSDHQRLVRIEHRLEGTHAHAEKPWESAFDPPSPEDRQRQVTHAEYKHLTKQVAQLQVMMSVLVEALGEKGVIDGAAAARRLKEKLDALEPKPAKKEPGQGAKGAATTTYRDAPAEKVEMPEMVACAKCQASIEKRSTRLTSHGAVCDRCFDE